jgi:SynChlorMet cassette protein ScmC
MTLGAQANCARREAVDVCVGSGQETDLRLSDGRVAVSLAHPGDDGVSISLQLLHAASAIALDAERRGGVLVHAALAERGGEGVLLAGPGMAGKSTASRRLPPPWRSLCDDTTLIVRDPAGRYWAHPWPTWSRFISGGPGGSWQTERAVPLRAVFFLTQDEQDRAIPVGAGQAATLLVEVSEQVLALAQRHVRTEEVRALRLRRFDNLCALAKAVPCYELHLSLTSRFWEEMERVLLKGDGP